ncbi:anti-sigma factor family protein [Flavihumibacter stibioxidans]|uniref:Zinc-finger domain-containing protein n=1 Tax=Flavihumibacter stibioxidans TaxID=1834163 RepID=A0ABR7MAV4_9BACT|nr:hypothetical protein [Flavihumibacter stibioxidans]MBC6492150.1 hypothetical protein [Flavihumibacter stibioxidans]
MDAQHNIEPRLWEYIDGLSTAEERRFIENLIATNAEWRSKYKELLQFNESLGQTIELEEPSMRFTRNVMEAIAAQHIAPAAKTYINKKIIFGIGGFMVSLILGMIIYALAQINWKSGTGSRGGFDLSKVDFSGLWNNNYLNAFMIINVVLGLMLLDRYLSFQKKDWKKI